MGAEALEYQLPTSIPEFGLLELDGGSVLGGHGWVIGYDGTLLPELSWYAGPSERIRIPTRLGNPLRLRGTCLSLTTEWSSENYAHFLLDALGRLALFIGSGGSFDDVDRVYCPVPPSEAAARLLDLFAIPPEKRLWAGPDVHVQADVLIVPSFPSHSLTYRPWLPRFLRRSAQLSDVDPGTRRLYISRRGHSRRPAKEPELEDLLRKYGFEIYQATNHLEQFRDFHEAAVVVGAHGAGLANLAFCRPGATVLELVPTENAFPFYYSLSVVAGLDYSYIAGPSVEASAAAPSFGPSPHNFVVEHDELDAALDEILAPTA
jgi:capsular polysaccharide biosynthesis protein